MNRSQNNPLLVSSQNEGSVNRSFQNRPVIMCWHQHNFTGDSGVMLKFFCQLCHRKGFISFIFRQETPLENRNVIQTGEKHLVFRLGLHIGKTLKNNEKSCFVCGLLWRPTLHGTRDPSRMHLVKPWEVDEGVPVEGRAPSPPACRGVWKRENVTL